MRGGVVMEFGTLFQPIQTSIMSALEAVIPIGLSIFAVIIAVRKGVSLLRGISGR